MRRYRKVEKTNDLNYGHFNAVTESGHEHGTFFRVPFAKHVVTFNDEEAIEYFCDVIKNPFRKLLEILIGNWPAVKDAKEFMESEYPGSILRNRILSPFYHERLFYRTTTTKILKESDISYVSVISFIDEEVRRVTEEHCIVIFKNGDSIGVIIDDGAGYQRFSNQYLEKLIYLNTEDKVREELKQWQKN